MAEDYSHYDHPEKRLNNPPVGLVTPATDGVEEQAKYAYDPHIAPSLEFDSGRAAVERLLGEALPSSPPSNEEGQAAEMRKQQALKAALKAVDENLEPEQAAALQAKLDRLENLEKTFKALHTAQAPFLNWTGKAERSSFEVPTISLHVHERIDPSAILEQVRKPDSEAPRQEDMFNTPFDEPPLREDIEFYRHERGWANRLVAGDSLLVMHSLLVKEGMAGKVQMIYIDPPYGIKYGSNFQPFTHKRDVKDGADDDLTREPEQIRAFRDTWELGIHSYLTYLRDRLLLARELLTESGSCFVQISDENLHHVRELMDEVFGANNWCGDIRVVKTSGQTDDLLATVTDNLLWYGKNKSNLKYKRIYQEKGVGFDEIGQYYYAEFDGGVRRRLTDTEIRNPNILPTGVKPFRISDISSNKPYSLGKIPFIVDGKEFFPASGRYWTHSQEGRERLKRANRILYFGNSVRFLGYLEDFPLVTQNAQWLDTGISGFSSDKLYVVQTNQKVIERCLLMTTEPGDLVFDPTCGSGTTAYVAEKWGRRWITCDTSRVALTLARQRLLTAGFEYFPLKYPLEGLKSGFIYKTVPHVTLKSIANNPEIDEIWEKYHPHIEQTLVDLNRTLTPNPSPASGRGELEVDSLPSPACGRGVGGEGLEHSDNLEYGYKPRPPQPIPPDLLKHARDMRKNATDAENLMWRLLRNRRIANAKFRRQHTIGRYIADFFCDEHKLVVELDGSQHAENGHYDAQRDDFMRKQGLTVLRFWNNQVLAEAEAVLQVIWNHIAENTTPTSAASAGGEKDTLTPTPLPQAGEGLKEWAVPFDFPKDWPEAAQAPFAAFHAARLAMQQRMDDSIARNASQETLFDQPKVDKKKVRVTGPFTVEAVPFPTVLSVEEQPSAQAPLPEGEGRMEANGDVARSGESARQHQWIAELLATGLRGKGGQKIELAELETLPGARYLHAVGTLKDSGERVAVSFGPEFAALEQRQVALALDEAENVRPTPKFLVFAAFSFDPEASKDIDETHWPGVTMLKAWMNADLLTDDLKKKGRSNESFWLIGQPDVEVVSGLWLVDRKNVGLMPYGLFKELSGLDRLEEIIGLGENGLPTGQRVPKGRNLRAHQSNTTGGGFDIVQYRAIEELNQRVSKLLGNSKRAIGGTGNPDDPSAELEPSDTRSERGSTEIFSGNWNATQRADALAKIKVLTSDQLPLTTDHYSQASVHGFDYFDIGKGEIRSGGRNNIAVWLLDTDYNGRSLLPTQVFFPMAGEKDGWSRLAKNLKAVLDESRIDAYHGTVSLPFKAGKYRRVAVKIVDDRGIESLVVKQLPVVGG